MKQNGFTTGIIKTLFYPACLLLLILLILQNDAWEKRFIEQRKESEKLKQNINRLTKAVERIGKKFDRGVMAIKTSNHSDKVADSSKWLHPHVPNFLKGKSPTPAPQGVNSEGEFHKVYGLQGVDPKGMNFIIENAAPLREDIQEYVSLSLAKRSPSDPSNFYGQLAHRVEVTDDYKLYTIYLKPGYVWHRPRVDFGNARYKWLDKEHQVTAHDFVYTLDLILKSSGTGGS